MTYTLTISEAQAQTISKACELLSRIGAGQIREAFCRLPLKQEVDWDAYQALVDSVHQQLPPLLKQDVDGWRSSLGVGHPDLPPGSDIAWDIHTTIRHRLAWDMAIATGKATIEDERTDKLIGCAYDPPMRFSNQPLPTIKRMEKSK